MRDLLKENGIQVWDDETIISFRKTLLDWYDTHKRHLPWRQTKDPYAIWVSEIMLQQTQVNTVIPYFNTFMANFPTIDALANADDTLLLKTWEGLGYYSRVKNMKVAAQQMMQHYGGNMPKTIDEIRTLKGIGPYTAGAIASIAFDLPEPAVDGNVMRVMARLFEINLDIAQPSSRKVFEQLIRVLIDPDRPGDFNQALMDLGSDICSAHTPKPEISPIREFNAAFKNGTMHLYPIKSKKQPVKHIHYIAYVYQNIDGAFLMEKRSETGLLANMWQFPMSEKKSTMPKHLQQDIIGSITHLFTHLKWHIDVVVIEQGQFNGSWIHPKDFQHYPMGVPQQKILSLLKEKTDLLH